MNTLSLLILDVDGVLTDGRFLFATEGEPLKSFCVRDGHALKLWRRAGGKVALLSGRSDTSLNRRAAELGIERVYTGVTDKLPVFENLLQACDFGEGDAVYIGDDLPDLPVMRRCGLAIAVADAAPDVKRVAHLVTRRRGGEGAVAEAVEWILRRQGQWTTALADGMRA